MAYYYWDPNFRTQTGETLVYCYQQYGTGTQKMNKNGICMEVIFLDQRRTFANSWVLRCYDLANGVNVPVKLYLGLEVVGRLALNS